MSEAPARSGLKDALTEVLADLKEAFRNGGAPMLVLPALRPLLGGLPHGCLVVSRGPWSLQRSLLWLLIDTQPRQATGPIDARIDEGSDGARNGESSPPPTPSGESTAKESVAVELVIHPRTLHEFMRYAFARTACVDLDDLRQGRIKDAEWSHLAFASGTLSEHPVNVSPGPLDTIVVRWADGMVCWRLLLTDAPDPESSDADVVAHLTLGERRIEIDVLDGRSDPPTRLQGRLIDGVLHAGPEDPDEACALDDRQRLQEEAAAARAWKDELEDDEDADVTLWVPPPSDGER